ncbi:MAG TPA: DUF72 domain-containing protein [Flavisolibacter sp.]|nr:DUF72 domain-containing protein [Flavisolibacter sp.]
MQKTWYIGCSGFHYKEWKDIFYPKGVPQSKWFAYYAEHFNTLELNVTFYRFPQLNTLKAWFDKAPAGFVFSAKVPRSITHFRKFDGTETLVKDFYAVLKEGLQDKLGCVLFQLPPQLVYSQENLMKIVEQADHSFRNVIEFRHESWWRDDVIRQLGEKNISFCGVSFPKIRFDYPVMNTNLVYYRFHGVPKLFYSEYDEAFLEKTARLIAAGEKAKTAFLYFNNTASLAALHNARFVQQWVLNNQ